MTVLDCAVLSPEYGLYSIATGERTFPDPPYPEGTKSLTTSDMVFEDGRWKDSRNGGGAGTDCQFAPTGDAVVIV